MPPPGPRSRSFLRKGSAQFGGQFVGLVLALLVSHLIARRMGIGPEADAFLLGRRLITSVSEMLNQVLVVVFIPLVAAQAAAGARLGRVVLVSAGPGLLVGLCLAAAFILGARGIVDAMAPGFEAPTRALAAQIFSLLALALPALIATVALSAYCNVLGVFGSPATIRQLPRAAVALALAVSATGAVAVGAAWAYALAAWLVILVTFAVTARAHRRPPHRVEAEKSAPQPTGASGLTRRSTAAIILAVGAMASLWLETAIAAAQGVGGVAMLDFGQRLGALLGNTLAGALALVVFADLSRRFARGETETLGATFQSATLTGLALLLPITVGVIANAEALVDLLLGYGLFAGTEGRREVVVLVKLMAIAPTGALVLRMMLARILAQDDLPVVRLVGGASLADFLTRIALFALLVPQFGLIGVPISLILAPIVPAAALYLILRGDAPFSGTAPLRRALPIMSVAALTAAAIVIGANLTGQLAPEATGKTQAALQIAMSGGLGAIVLAVSAVGLRVRPRLT